MSKVYSLAEVAAHNTAEDCWIIVHGKVYDVTKFLNEHPGKGKDRIPFTKLIEDFLQYFKTSTILISYNLPIIYRTISFQSRENYSF
jgi:cytochrome b involved in lipid metabolism